MNVTTAHTIALNAVHLNAGEIDYSVNLLNITNLIINAIAGKKKPGTNTRLKEMPILAVQSIPGRREAQCRRFQAIRHGAGLVRLQTPSRCASPVSAASAAQQSSLNTQKDARYPIRHEFNRIRL